ncbi:MAG: hypothetical protein ACXV9S_14050 [Acidimicrobiia bacterium]
MTPPTAPAAHDDEDRVGAAGPRRRAWIAGGLAVVLVAALVVGLAAEWSRTSDLETRLATATRGARQARVAGDRLSARIDKLATSVGDLPDAPAGADGGVAAVKRDITTFKQCVNDYMKTIGTWSTNVNNQYHYTFC